MAHSSSSLCFDCHRQTLLGKCPISYVPKLRRRHTRSNSSQETTVQPTPRIGVEIKLAIIWLPLCRCILVISSRCPQDTRLSSCRLLCPPMSISHAHPAFLERHRFLAHAAGSVDAVWVLRAVTGAIYRAPVRIWIVVSLGFLLQRQLEAQRSSST